MTDQCEERSRSGQNSSEGTGSAAKCTDRDSANHDAAPAARASEATASPERVRVRGDAGTGDTDHGASPEAIARVGRPRTDKADLPTRAGTGDTPATHATRGEGSEQRECTEPVAWAVMLADGERIYDVYATEEEAKAIDEAVTGNHGVIPLYRSPTLTDAEREAVEFAAAHGETVDAAWRYALRGLLERMGGGE